MANEARPLVSISCITYNQEKYIAEALDGFLMQETNFSFEVLIHDDASTDNTPNIIKEYEKKYPDIIKPIYQIENQFSQGKNISFTFNLPRAKGKYVAFCEGDDYWTDATKLQRQVDFMEKNLDYALVFHPVHVFFQNHEKEDSIFPEMKSGFTVKRLLESNFIQTNSVMYRRLDDYSGLSNDVMPGDWYLHLYHAQFGKIGFINRVMSAYRRHESGIWWGTSGEDRDELWKKHGIAHLALYLEQMMLFGDRPAYRSIIEDHIVGTIDILLRVDSVHKTTLLKDGFIKNLRYNSELLRVLARVQAGLYNNNKAQAAAAANLRSDTEVISQQKAALEKKIANLQADIDNIRSSKRYIYSEKIANSFATVRSRVKRLTRRGH